MTLAEIESAVDTPTPEELANLTAFIRASDNAAWDRQVDSAFAAGGRLREVADEVRADDAAWEVNSIEGPDHHSPRCHWTLVRQQR